MFFSSASRRERGGMQMQEEKGAYIFIIGRLYTGLKCIRRLLMLVGSGNEKTLSDVFVSIGRMLVCLRGKSWSIKSHGLDGRYRIQGGRRTGHGHVMVVRRG
jgi:hypothetical protein